MLKFCVPKCLLILDRVQDQISTPNDILVLIYN